MDTYRLTHVPESYTAEQIKDLFSIEDQNLIIGPISLGCSVYATETKSKVATISFKETPAFIQKRLEELELNKDAVTPSNSSTGDNLQNFVPVKRHKFDWNLCDAIDVDKAKMMRIDNRLEGLTPLNELSKSDDTTIDVIASTGLAGRAFGSWQHPNGAMWLRDFLPRDAKGVRVFIWGQTSRLENSRSHMTINDLRDMLLEDLLRLRPTTGESLQPLVLMGHSLGGIIIKAVCAEASQKEEYKFLSQCIQGLVFFGTPHRGMVTEHWEELWGNDPPQTIIRDLKPGSSYLQQLSSSFQKVIADIGIISCFECEESPTVRRDECGIARKDGHPILYVPRSSACLEHAQEKQIPINADHSMVARLSGSEGTPYYNVKNSLDGMFKDIRIRMQKRHDLEYADRVLEGMLTFLRFGLEKLSEVDSLVLAEQTEVQTLQNALKSTAVPVLDDSFRKAVADLELINCEVVKAFGYSGGGSFESSNDGLYRINGALLRWDDTFGPETQRNLAEQAVMPLLSLGWLFPSKNGMLEKFMMNRSFDHPGLDMIALQQRKLDAVPADLNPLNGRYEESETPINGLLLGTYYPGDGSPNVEVLLETRQYGDSLAQYDEIQKHPAISRLHEGAQKLASHMKSGLLDFNKGPAPNKLLQDEIFIFQCHGWIHEWNSQRFVFLYKIPRPLRACFRNQKSDIMTLGTWVKSYRSRKPYLEEIFSTAYHICRTVFKLHISGWLHKNINPENIVLIPRSGEGKDVVSSKAGKQFFVPYLKGFEFSRSVQSHSDREAAKDTECDVYRHPSRQGKPDNIEKFGLVHDIYAVGVVLLEIGKGRKVEDDLKPFKRDLKGRKPRPSEIRDQLLKLAEDDLPSYLGTRYSKCVQRCLNGLEDDDTTEYGGTRSVFAFRHQVVDELRRMASACGADI